MRYLVLDLATCPIEGAEAFLEEPSAPANYKDPEKIAAYIADARMKALEKAALDPDLGRISALGLMFGTDSEPVIQLCRTEEDERAALRDLSAVALSGTHERACTLVGYNAMEFDWPFLVRRAAYLGVKLSLNLDRYKSPHIDVAERMTHRGMLKMKSLGFYVKRLGWTDLFKPLSGAQEALAPAEGKWDELEASVRHDLVATARLAEWWGVIEPAYVSAEAVI